jgi:hypothetical protein
MSNRNQDKGRLGPFVALLKDTMASTAWRAMTPHARIVYVALKARYNSNQHNNGRLFLSYRNAMEETGLNSMRVLSQCFRELQHYGFIVLMEPGCLGVDGKGKAPHWRLTELGCFKEPPTNDFLHWDGTIFPVKAGLRGAANPKHPWRHKNRIPHPDKQQGAPRQTTLVHPDKEQSNCKVHPDKQHTGGKGCTQTNNILSKPLLGPTVLPAAAPADLAEATAEATAAPLQEPSSPPVRVRRAVH